MMSIDSYVSMPYNYQVSGQKALGLSHVCFLCTFLLKGALLAYLFSSYVAGVAACNVRKCMHRIIRIIIVQNFMEMKRK